MFIGIALNVTVPKCETNSGSGTDPNALLQDGTTDPLLVDGTTDQLTHP